MVKKKKGEKGTVTAVAVEDKADKSKGKGQALLDPTLSAIQYQTERLGEIYRSLMKKDTDYGVVPGTQKPSLWKAGAELLRLWRGYIPEFEVTDKIVDLAAGLFHYEFRCTLYKAYVIKPSGEAIPIEKATPEDKAEGSVVKREIEGIGYGSCNSLESKYRFRWLPKSKLPPELDPETLVKRFHFVHGKSYVQYRVDNDNPQDLGNTVLKQAKKRSFIDAILNATGASRIFTQDIGEEPEPENEGTEIRVEGAEVDGTEVELDSEETVVTISD